MTENEISYQVRGAAFEVYNYLGPGLLESIYCKALYKEIKNRGLRVRYEVPVAVTYKEDDLNIGLRLDLLVENKVIIEIKSIEDIHRVHHKQVLTYLRITGLKLGLLINFNTDNLEKSIYRKVNNL